jgi:hypothetical protein
MRVSYKRLHLFRQEIEAISVAEEMAECKKTFEFIT